MVRRKFLTLLGTALLVVAPEYVMAQQPLPPATSSAGVEQKTEEASPPAKSYTPAERQAYQKKTAATLAEMQAKVDEIKITARTVKQQKKRSAARMVVALQIKANVAKNTLAALEKSTGTDWDRLKAEMDKTMADFSKTYNEVEAQLQ